MILFFLDNLLKYTILLPFFSALCIFLLNKKDSFFIKKIALFLSLVIFLFSLILWLFFDNAVISFQYIFLYKWLSYFNINLIFGLDGMSLLLIVLTTFLTSLCILASWSTINNFVSSYFILFFLLEGFVIITFSTLDLIIFYIFFESVLIPMFLIIGIWGARDRKIRASYLFYIYTFIGSLFMLFAIFAILLLTGTTNFLVLKQIVFSETLQKFLWAGFFASFAVKVPMFPFHIWLPEAHVEAPTTGSVILAGLLLKLGTYGLLRFSIPLFPHATYYFTPFVGTLALCGIIYASLTAIRQIDVKRIIAYSSVAHMNLVVLGIISNNVQGIEGSILQMISHGLVSSGLFLCIGVIYDRTHTRSIKHYGGLVVTMPLFSLLFLVLILANLAFPGTSNFIGEVLLFVSIVHYNIFICFVSMIAMVLSAAYSLWLYNRIIFGNTKIIFFKKSLSDLTKREFHILGILTILVIIIGVYPNFIMNTIRIAF